MKQPNTAQAVPTPAPPPPINAKFRDRLPAIIDDICDELLTIEPAVARLTVHLEEIQDYLDHEIKKVDLDLKVMKWESKVDPEEVKRKQDWLNELTKLKSDFHVDIMTSPPLIIRSMVTRFRQMFGVLPQ